MPERRTGPLELRAEGRALTGPAMRYGDVSPSHRERFEPGAFALDARTRWLDVRHDRDRVIAHTAGGGLELTDTREALMVRAELPEIPAADRALADVAAGRLRGFSIEFNAVEERRESGIRVVSRADLSGIGLVGSPSYTQSAVEIRARSGRTMTATFPKNKQLACKCSGVGCKWAKFVGESFQKMMDEAFQGALDDLANDTIAAFGSFDTPLASRSSGTLRGRVLANGDGQVEIDLPDSPAGAATVAADSAAGVIVRPYIDRDLAESVLEGETRVYHRAPLRGVIVSATDQREGWPAPKIAATPDELIEDASALARRRNRRRRAWL